MPPSTTVTALSRANEFPEDFVEDNGIPMCRFCDHRVSFLNKSSVTSNIAGAKHIQRRASFEKKTKK